MPRAILSVSDKTGIIDLARGLAARGYELVSTGGTARDLAGAGLAVTSVAALTGFPEMLDGRVKTLHPALHGGILARRDQPADLDALARHGIGLVDIVVVNLYPFVETARKPDVEFDELVEQIDIGGPSMVRAAAKNFRHVLVVVDPADYPRLIEALDRGPTLAFRFDLMRKAIAHTAAYDTAIAETLGRVQLEHGEFSSPVAAGQRLRLTLQKIRDLRYGENPHQQAAWYAFASGEGAGSEPLQGGGEVPQDAAAPAGAVRPEILQGRELSYTNLLDVDAAARLVAEFDEPAAVVIKHTNPCGAATGVSAADACVRARDADSMAAFGGIVGLNRPIDAAAAQAIVSTFIEAVIAPGVDADARVILGRKPNMRVLTADINAVAAGGREFRSVLGGVLVQDRDRVVEAQQAWTADVEALKVVTRRQPTDEEWRALRFAWRVCAHVKSNTVIFTDASRTLAIGAGQMSRVDAVNVAVMKAQAAGVALTNSVAASDAFFPFRDGLDAIAAAGATAVVQPGGSVRDPEVIAAADEHGLAMVLTGRRHFRH